MVRNIQTDAEAAYDSCGKFRETEKEQFERLSDNCDNTLLILIFILLLQA